MFTTHSIYHKKTSQEYKSKDLSSVLENNFEQKILKLLPEEKYRKEVAKRGQDFVYRYHTYHHRAHDMLLAFGLEKEAKALMSNYYVYFYKGLTDELEI